MNLLAQLQIPGPPGAPIPDPGTSPPPEAVDIRDILPPVQPPDYLQLALVVVFAGLAVCLVAWAVILFLRLRENRRNRTAPPLPPYEVALEALKELHANAANLTPNQFGLETSNIIKRYFHDRYDDPLLFETSEEFAVRENHKKSIPHSKRTRLSEFFERCDLLKYASFPGAETEAPHLLEEALTLIHEPAIPEAAIATTQYLRSSNEETS